jgi:GABA(A) receptor-associated protein
MLFSDSSYKNQKVFAERKNESERIKFKYPNRIPVICENSEKNLDITKYLVPHDITIGQFMYIIRKRLKLDPHDALYLFANGYIMSCSNIMITVYNNYKDLDGFLYFKLSKESTFGNLN